MFSILRNIKQTGGYCRDHMQLETINPVAILSGKKNANCTLNLASSNVMHKSKCTT